MGPPDGGYNGRSELWVLYVIIFLRGTKNRLGHFLTGNHKGLPLREILVYLGSGLATIGEGADHERGAAGGIAADEDILG